MEWHKKTDAQYDAYMTVMVGGDVENEAHFKENEWLSITTALSDFIDLMDSKENVDDLREGVYDLDSMRSLKDAIKKLRRNEEVTVPPTSTDSNLKSSKSQYAWSDDVSLWLTNALALPRGKKGKGLNLNPLYSDILYSDIWKVEATLVDAGIIGKAWHEAE